jgi:hypothetical protein
MIVRTQVMERDTHGTTLTPGSCFEVIWSEGGRTPCPAVVAWHGRLQSVHKQSWEADACDEHQHALIDRYPLTPERPAVRTGGGVGSSSTDRNYPAHRGN